MSLRLITPPAALAVSLDAARTAARMTGTSLDAEIERHVRAITKEAEHATGRAFITQTWRLTLDAFPAMILIPRAPLIALVSVKYYDADGVLQTLTTDDYLVDAESEPARVTPAPDTCWPATQTRVGAVQVNYSCGYGADDSAVPEEAKDYILAMLEQIYYPSSAAEYLPRLLDSLQVYG